MEDESVTARSDVASFEAFYREERLRMVRLAHLMTGSNAVAEELVQDAFVEMHRRWTGIRNPKAYLTRSVVNRTHSYHRRRAVERRHPQPVPTPTLPAEIDETWAVLQDLPIKRRTALVLRYYEDRTIDEIARLMGVRPGTVKSLIHRGLKTLRERLS